MTRPQRSPLSLLSLQPPSSRTSSSYNGSLLGWFVVVTILVSFNLNAMKQLSSSLQQPGSDNNCNNGFRDHPTIVSTRQHDQLGKDDNDEAAATATTTTVATTITDKYPTNDGNVIGILSTLPNDYFQTLRDKIDYYSNNVERCQRYGWTYTGPSKYNTHGLPPIKRKIFFGSLIANEPWELFEIIGVETYSIYSGIVFVESNRTQNFTPRNTTRLQHTTTFQRLFNTSNVQVRHFSNEDSNVTNLMREHAQRNDILKGWYDIGMKRNDVGIVADADECQTRDFLRALQICDGIDSLNYEMNSCKFGVVGIRGHGEVYESSPDCITKDKRNWHPIIHIGHCIDYIGNTTLHIKSAYNGRNRAPGYGGGNKLNLTLTNGSIPIFTAIDFRTGLSGYYPAVEQKGYGSQTGYHFHNFFTSLHDLRYKYHTYGHPKKAAMSQNLESLASVAVHCARNVPDPEHKKNKRVLGGYNSLLPFKPIYFHDPIYRQKRHEFLKQLIQQEDRMK